MLLVMSVSWGKKMELLEGRVLKKEKWVSGEAEARRRTMARSGAAWEDMGKAKTATCCSVDDMLFNFSSFLRVA